MVKKYFGRVCMKKLLALSLVFIMIISFTTITHAVIYDPEDTSVTAKLYDENGDEIAWESLKINDIVAIKRF